MKKLPAFAIALLSLTTACFAQTVSSTTLTSSEVVETAKFDITTDIPVAYATKKVKVHNWIVVMRTSGGQVQYQIDPSSIAVVDDGSGLDDVSTAEIFDRISIEAVNKGLSLGYSTNSSTTKVLMPYAVTRSGSEETTSFASASSGTSEYDFTISWNGVITQTSTAAVPQTFWNSIQ